MQFIDFHSRFSKCKIIPTLKMVFTVLLFIMGHCYCDSEFK